MSSSSRRGILLVVLLLVVAFAISGIGLLVLVFTAGAPPPVPSNATLYLKVQAPFSEVQVVDPLFTTPPPTLRAVIDAIHQAGKDSRIKSLVVMPRVEGALWAQLQEVRAALLEYRKSGKPLTAYLEYGGAQEYFVASAADRVVLMPAGQLDLAGLASYELFFRGALDKVGVYPDLLHVGDYKTASNTFTEHGFTPAHKEMTQSLNSDWYGQLVRAIADGRKKPEAEVRTIINNGPFLADEARKAGLVDELLYEDGLEGAPPILGTQRLEGESYVKALPSTLGAPNRIALLYAVGTIASGKSSFDGLSGNVVGSETFNQWVRKVRLDSSIRAIVIRIDSPGGSAIASDVMWRELMLARAVKPVIVSMGDVAASGGYYIAVPAHVIVAEPGTITGSIGVVTGKFVLGGALDKLGIATDAVSDGKLAEIYSPFKKFSPDERARIDSQMRTTYDLFVSRVAEGRQQDKTKINAVGQGRVWTGLQAKERGLVDEIGGLDTAIRIAKERARLDPTKEVDLAVYPMKRSFLELLEDPFGVKAHAPGNLTGLMSGQDARVVTSALSIIRLFRRGEPLAVMPNIFWN